MVLKANSTDICNAREGHRNGQVPVMIRVSYRGGRGGAGIPPPPPPQEILKLSMVIVVLSQVLSNNLIPDYVRSNLRGSKFKIFLGGGGGGGACPQTPLVGTHAYAC